MNEPKPIFSPHHFIREFEAHRGSFQIYMALCITAGDISAPPTTQCQINLKWLKDEVRMEWRTISSCLRFFKDHGILSTEERLDTLYYKFLVGSHDEVVNKIRSIAGRVRPSEKEILRDHIFGYLNLFLIKAKNKKFNRHFVLARIRAKIVDMQRMNLSYRDVDDYFNKLASRSVDEDVDVLLSPLGDKNSVDLTKESPKVVGWDET